MPKLKTKKSVAKRFRITKKGKAVYSKAGRRHLLSGRSEKRKRNLRKKGTIDKVEFKMIRAALPYA
jgi:large subunit ribosomal protein L35